MARIVMLSSFPVYPANDGGRVRIHELATHLARKHEVIGVPVCERSL